MKALARFCCALLVCLGALAPAQRAAACTGIRLEAQDGTIVYARTMEFAQDMDSNPIIVPRNFKFQGTTMSGKPGLTWEAKFGAVGMNGMGQMVIVDGVNEKGLAGGIFYLPGYAQYQTVTAADESKAVAPWELITWILTNFSTADEVRAALPGIKVANVVFEGTNPPLHYIVHDVQGDSLVIEYIDGKLAMHDNPIGVITNSPDFEWHIKNLSNYVNLSATNAEPEQFDGLTIRQLGQGSGLLGVPGDFTPPSRFVKAFVLARAAVRGDNGPRTVQQAFHILDSFDIPSGVVRGDEGGQTLFERTQWTSASDTKNLIYYFHTHDNRRVRQIDLQKVNFDSNTILAIPAHGQEDYENLTPNTGA